MIKFSLFETHLFDSKFSFCNQAFPVVHRITHFRMQLMHNCYDDDDDISFKSRQLIRSAKLFFCTLGDIDPMILTFLFKSYCLSLYGACLWILSCKFLHTLEVTFNRWHILHFTMYTHVFYTVYTVSIMLCNGAWSVSWITPYQAQTDLSASVIFWEDRHLRYNFTTFNDMYGDTFGKQYSDQVLVCADIIRCFQCWPWSIQLLRSEQVQISEMLHIIATV